MVGPNILYFLQLMMTVSTILTAFYFLPMEPGNEEHMYQVSSTSCLMVFVWDVTPCLFLSDRCSAIGHQGPMYSHAQCQTN